jgi:hypothetical protein
MDEFRLPPLLALDIDRLGHSFVERRFAVRASEVGFRLTNPAATSGTGGLLLRCIIAAPLPWRSCDVEPVVFVRTCSCAAGLGSAERFCRELAANNG